MVGILIKGFAGRGMGEFSIFLRIVAARRSAASAEKTQGREGRTKLNEIYLSCKCVQNLLWHPDSCTHYV